MRYVPLSTQFSHMMHTDNCDAHTRTHAHTEHGTLLYLVRHTYIRCVIAHSTMQYITGTLYIRSLQYTVIYAVRHSTGETPARQK